MDCHICMDNNVECTKCKQCNFECCDDCLIGLYKHRTDAYSNKIKCPVCKKKDRFNVVVKTNWKPMKNPTWKKVNQKLRKIHKTKTVKTNE